jgi:hypothetical protein
MRPSLRIPTRAVPGQRENVEINWQLRAHLVSRARLRGFPPEAVVARRASAAPSRKAQAQAAINNAEKVGGGG